MVRRSLPFLLVLALACGACADDDERATETLPGSEGDPVTSTSLLPATVSVPPGDLATVVTVFDGDSLEVDLDGRTQEVRLIGINAPEGSECYGDQARSALGELLGDEPMTLVSAGDDDQDRFGRLLRFVYAADVFVNAEMARRGAAVVFQSGQPLEEEFKALEQEAYAAGRGMWERGVCGDEGDPDVRILTIEYDPPGRDSDNKEDEFVGIGNTGSDAADLSGWVLRDETSQHRYTFPTGFVLEPDGIVRVRVGCGADDADDLYWCADDALWSNGGDTALLLDANGNVIDRLTYAGDF